MTRRNLYYNYISHPNYFDDGGIVYIQDSNGFVRPDSVQTINGNYTSGINPQNAVLNDYQLNQVNKAERKQTANEKAQNFIDNMNGGGASGWNAIGPAASNIASAFLDTESDLADRTAAAMGMPALANIWKADWKKGNEALTDYRNKLNNIKKNSFIQDASSSWGAANAVKLNSKPIAPITPQSQLLTWKDFRGNMFMKGAGAVAQGAASGSVGGPWGAAGGAITGLFSSLFGGIGAKKRAKSAYNSYLNKWQTLNSANQAAFDKAVKDQTLSNMQALANGNTQQRINDMTNIRAYGGNLYPNGGTVDDGEKVVQEPIYEGGELPEIDVIGYKYPAYEPANSWSYPETADPESVEWLANWLDKRRPQLYNNLQNILYSNYLKELAATRYVPKREKEYDFYTFVPKNKEIDGYGIKKEEDIDRGLLFNETPFHGSLSTWFNDKFGDGSYRKNDIDIVYNNQIHNAASATEGGQNTMYQGTTILGDYTPAYGLNSWNENSRTHTVSYNPDFYKPIWDNEEPYSRIKKSVRLHERAHAANAIPQEETISKIMENAKDRDGNPIKKDEYLDKDTEIYSRLMEERYRHNLNPTKTITKKDLEQMREESKNDSPLENHNILNRYDDETLLRLFNEVAKGNNDMKRYSNVVAFGGGLDLSPNMMNLWNNKQQIDQQKVNMQQMNFGLGNSFNQKLNTFDYGGSMNGMDLPTGMQSYENGGTHEQNPYGGIQVGVDQQGNPNLVEEGEFRWGDYVFSDRINVDPTLLSRYNLAPATKHQGKKANKGKLSYADMAKKYAKKNGELANDPIGKNTLEAYMKRLQDAQEDQKFQDSMEQQKQDAINQYRNALTTPQQGNPMYGAMKYNGMGNAATQQGINAGMSDLGQQSSGNEVLSNTNRSGNNMLHAFGGNLFWDGGVPQIKPKLLNVNPNLVLGNDYMDRWTTNNVGTPRLFSSTTPMFTGENPEANFTAYQKRYPTLPSDAKGMQQLLVNEGFDIGNTGPNKDGVDGIWGNKSQAAWYDFLRAYNHRPNTINQYDLIGSNNQPSTSNTQASENGGLNLGIRDGGATTDVINNGGGQNSVSYNVTTNTGRQDLTGNLGGNTGSVNSNNNQTDRTTTTTFGTAATKEDPKQVPHYSTAGEYAMFGKGAVPMLYDWMNKTNFRYDPNQRPAYELADMGNNSTFLRTADTIGGYRAPNLIDVERMNNAAQAQGLAALQSALSTANGNRGFAAAQAAQNAYNTQMGIGNNYATTQQINNDERFKNDSFNTALDQANANIRNSMYQDNQKAQQVGQQMAIDTKKAANDYILRNELYADATNRQAMENRAANQATWTDNALNYFIAQAQKNDILNAKNNDITNPYWTDKNGVMHYIGDSGLNSAIYDAFTSDKDEWGNYAVNNGTFSGDRLKDWNKLLEKHGAAVLAANPDLWKSLVLQEKQERRKEAEKADKAKSERVANARYAFDNNMAQLNNYRAIYGDKFKNSQMYDDLMRRYNDKANATEFNDINNLDYWNRIMGDEIDYWRKYNTPVTANQSAYGGYINNNNKSNKREYYNYMRR